MSIISVSDQSFETEVLDSDIPVLIDFWAPWCGPCQAIAPLLEEIAQKYSNQVKVVKLNIDDNPDVPVKFKVLGIPTLMIFKDGICIGTKAGAMQKSQLSAFIDSNINVE